MASKNELTGKEVNCASATETNDDAVVTVTSPTDSTVSTIYVTGIIFSASGEIAAPVAATLVGPDGGDLTFQIPDSKIAPIVLMFGVHPPRITPGDNAVLTLPALGSGIVGTATLMYYIGAA